MNPPAKNDQALEKAFEELIHSFIENKVGQAENFLPPDLAGQLRANLLALQAAQQLRQSGIGNKARLLHQPLIRSDVIYWMDQTHNDPTENRFFDLIDQFVSYLNQTCYAGITGYEFHYALYPKNSFYKRHLDQFRDNKSRSYTMIMYLNDGWNEADGGQLCVYHPDHTELIAPTFGKCVLFKSSELEHEVLLSHQPRLSVTGWLKRD